MQFLNGITMLLLYQLLGEFIVRYLKLPVPGPVVGMILLFLTLLLRGTIPPALDTAGSGLLSHLSLLFVPAGVGLMVHGNRIADEWLPITVTLLLSTVITMTVTAMTMFGVRRILTGKVKKHD